MMYGAPPPYGPPPAYAYAPPPGVAYQAPPPQYGQPPRGSSSAAPAAPVVIAYGAPPGHPTMMSQYPGPLGFGPPPHMQPPGHRPPPHMQPPGHGPPPHAPPPPPGQPSQSVGSDRKGHGKRGLRGGAKKNDRPQQNGGKSGGKSHTDGKDWQRHEGDKDGKGSITVEGCKDATVSKIVRGKFVAHSVNHGKTVWKRTTQVNRLDVLIYYWDARDGPSLHGWWFAPKIGGDAVWAYSPTCFDSTLPPKEGWKVPYDASVDSTMVLAHQSTSSSAGVKRPAEDAGDSRDTRGKFVPPPVKKPVGSVSDSSSGPLNGGHHVPPPAHKRQEHDDKVKKFIENLRVLVQQAEAMSLSLQEQLKGLEVSASDGGLEQAAKVAEEVEGKALEMQETHKKVSGAVLSNNLSLPEECKQDLVDLLGRMTKCGRNGDTLAKQAKAIKDKWNDSRIQSARKAAALKQDEKQKELFAKYDKDTDDVLNEQEVLAFIREEYSFEIVDDALAAIMKELVPDGAIGVPCDSFGRLRSKVGFAKEEARNKQRRKEKEEKEREIQKVQEEREREMQKAQEEKEREMQKTQEEKEVERQKGLKSLKERESSFRASVAEVSAALEGAAALVSLAESNTASGVDDARGLLGPLRERLESLLAGSTEEPKLGIEVLAAGKDVQDRLSSLFERLERVTSAPGGEPPGL